MRFSNIAAGRKIGVGLLALLASLSLIYAQRPGSREESAPAPRSEPSRAPAPVRAPVERGPAVVDRVTHGSIRHVDTHVVARPGPVRANINVRENAGVRRDVVVHRDVEADVNRSHFWGGFVFGRRVSTLRPGYWHVLVGGVPYFCDDGIYYQAVGSDYQEVYPPVGANIPDLPDGAIEIDDGDTVYYFAGGAFYVQADGGYVIAQPPMGVTVPELPPGAVSVNTSNGPAYQFNGIYYQPVFVDGVTQYQTFTP